MPDTPPIQPTEAERLAQSAFVLGMASLLCGITALPAIVQSIRALIALRKGNANRIWFLKAMFSLGFSICVLGLAVLIIFLPFQAAQAEADQINCANNLKTIGVAIRVYQSDNNDTFPGSRWCDLLATNASEDRDFKWDLAKSLRCREMPKGLRCGYAMNRNLVGIHDTNQISPNTVLLFESDAGWNAVGGPEIAVSRHFGKTEAILVDDTIQETDFKNLQNLRWNPLTNLPAK